MHILILKYFIAKKEGGFPGGSVVKNPPANARDRVWSQGQEESPWEGNGNPLQFYCPGNPVDRGASWGYSPWDSKKATEHTHSYLVAKSCLTLCDPHRL